MSETRDKATDRTPPAQAEEWSFSSCCYHDFTAQEGGLEGFEQHYRQLSKGPFSGRIDSLRLGEMCLSRERSNRALENEFRFPDERMCLAFPADSSGCGTGSFGELRPGSAIMPPAGRDNRFYMPEGTDMLILSLPAEPEIERACLGNEVRGASFTPWLCTLLEIAARGYACEELVSVLPDLIRDHLSLLEPAGPAAPGPTQRDRAVFDEILQACASLMPEDLTVSGLAARLSRSRAELRQACMALSGLRLDDLLSARRMNEVYRALREAEGPVQVGRVALDYGYMHAGRFSLAFREMFGMRPRDARASAQ